ncbi:methyl-accepting chemotaxis protein [Paenibacillus sp. NEAU-GSW1]|uniref:methyl-accepting chemotaxis protein n=1 Tax=Paenibacillus sp. NEAU-GSW1 TaxID=2682486 RepID=UPI0012E16730|nr:methyl-accepting chemotaxis protein [Paenibacillus sp. NEAU-GSW1]MUT64829.1 HAMP domain-containing protein [Paenibacillus sp. NEAU-GSW1]
MSGFRSRLVFKLSIIILAILIILSGTLIYMQLQNTKKASEEAIGNFNIHLAEAYAALFDVKSYESFLQEQKETELYWSIREEMNRYRERIGALYVYTVQIDGQGQPILLIDGQPKDSDSASPIGEVTDMPKDAIEAVLKGQAAKSGIIENPEYGDYISSYAPLHDSAGKVIGVMGIDTDVSVSQAIYRDVIKQSIPLFVMMGALTLMFFAFLVWFMFRALRPLGKIVKGAEAIAGGDIAAAKVHLGEIRTGSKDEIGQAYSAMIKMIERLGATLGSVIQDMKATTNNLVLSTGEFGAEADQLVKVNVELEQSIAMLADGAQHQRLGAEESAKSMEDITSAIQRVSEASAHVSGASGEALELAEQGQRSIHELKAQVASISEVTMQTANSVQLLNSYMGEIEPVLQSITSIADQTKLLALNASIEAARAGEHGSGFAVVAGEVRKLAEAASISVQHITSLLQQISQESMQIGERMQTGSEEMRKGTALSNEAETLFDQTLDRFVLVNSQIQEISAAAQEVLAGSEEVAASVEQISQISVAAADNTAAIQNMSAHQLEAAKRIADTTEQLKQRSASLEEAVLKFKL